MPNYRDYHRSLSGRALNQDAVLGDATIEAPWLEALRDTRYNCQASAAMGCTAPGIRAAVPDLFALLDHPQWIAREQAVIGLGELAYESVVAALAPPCRAPSSRTTVSRIGYIARPPERTAVRLGYRRRVDHLGAGRAGVFMVPWGIQCQTGRVGPRFHAPSRRRPPRPLGDDHRRSVGTGARDLCTWLPG